MGLLAQLFTGGDPRATFAPADDFWYHPVPSGGATQAGMGVGAESSLRAAAVHGCVRLIAGMMGTLPLILYRSSPDGDRKERAVTNPLFRLLHDQPNGWQTSKDWRTWGGECLLLRGNWYNEILLDGRFAIKELRPLHPDRVTVTLLDSGRRGYVYQPAGDPKRVLTQDDVFHVTGPFSLDGGVTGCSVVSYAREAIGAAQAAQGFASTFWSQGAEGHLAFVAPSQLSDPVRKANEAAIQARMAGWQNAHKPILLEGGLKPERISVTSRDSQYIESRKFSVEEICMFFGTSPDMIGHNDGTSQWGTGIESRKQGFIDFTLMPWLVGTEQAIKRDLVVDDAYFAKFNVDAFLRGNTVERSQAHKTYVDSGIKSVNEVRVLEELDPLDGEEFDTPHRAGNLGGEPGGGTPATTPRGPTAPPSRPAEPDPSEARAVQITQAMAARLVRKEIAAIRKWSARYAGNRDAWTRWVADFYGTYVADLETSLALDTATARRYCAERCAMMVEHGGQLVCEQLGADYEHTQPAALAALALGRPLTPAGGVHVTFAEGAFVNHHHMPAPQLTIAEGAIQVAGPTIHTPEVMVDARTTVEPAVIHVAPAPVTIAKGAIQSRTRVLPTRVTFPEGAIQVYAPVSVEPPAVTIDAGAVQVTTQVAAPQVVLPPTPPLEVKKTVERDATGRITGTTETYVR